MPNTQNLDLEEINIGQADNDGTGDKLRPGAGRLKRNFDKIDALATPVLKKFSALSLAAKKIFYSVDNQDIGTLDLDLDPDLGANSETSLVPQKTIRTYIATLLQSQYNALSTAFQTSLDEQAAEADQHLTDQLAAQAAGFQGQINTLTATINNLVDAQDVLSFKGLLNASNNPNYPAASAGHVYRITTAGKIGGASGKNVGVLDLIICVLDNSPTGNQASVGNNWVVINLTPTQTGNVIGAASSIDSSLVAFDGTTGKLIKDGGVKVRDDSTLSADTHNELPTVHAVYAWVAAKISEYDAAHPPYTPPASNTPSESIVTLNVPVVPVGQSTIVSVTIPSKRLYGVNIALSAVSVNMKLEFLGQTTTDVQYTGNFTPTLTADPSQAWRYRDRVGDLKLRARVTNNGAANLEAFTITVTTEPF